MRRFLSILIAPLPLLALYNGNPSLPMMPQKGLFIPDMSPVSVKLGYEIDWVYASPLKAQIPHASDEHVHGFESLSQFSVLTVNFIDRVELFANMGALSFHWHQPGDLSYHVDPSFAYGGGGRAILAYWGDLQLSGQAAYIRSSPAVAKFRQWQVGGGISYRFGWFFPYVGVDYINMNLKTSTSELQMRDPFGIYLGMGLGWNRGWNLNFEARFINEDALSFSTDIKF